MDLLEYQAKKLFKEVGIPILPSQQINHPTELKNLQIPYPIVLKSQVSVGSRAKAGGVRFVENTVDAIAAARTIFNLPISGEYPQVLLAEAKYATSREFYLAIVLDNIISRPVLLGSVHGGINLDVLIDNFQQVVVDQEFSPFYARRLSLKMGLTGELMLAVSEIIEKMYKLMVAEDLDLVEINPLAVSNTGKVMALDGKIRVNSQSLARHPDLIELLSDSSSIYDKLDSSTMIIDVNKRGNIGIICSGIGLALASLDGICQLGGQVQKVVIIDDDRSIDLVAAIAQLQDFTPNVVLLNLLSHHVEPLVELMKELCSLTTCHWIIRIIGVLEKIDLTSLDDEYLDRIKIVNSFDQAISQTVHWAGNFG